MNLGSTVGAARLRRVLTAGSWAAADQALFALSNFVVNIAVARGGGAESLGRFAIAFAAYLAVLGLSRALVSEPVLALAAERLGVCTDRAAVTVTLVWAGAGAGVVGAVGLLLGRSELVVMAVALPVALLQDLLRYQAFTRKKPHLAAVLDGLWLVGSLAAWPIVTAGAPVEIAIALWAGGALLGVVVMAPVFRPVPARLVGAWRWWWADARSLAVPLLADGILVVISTQALVVVVSSMAGDEALGLLRAGQVYFGPLGMVFTALGVLVVPRLAQRGRRLVGVSVATKLSLGMSGLAVAGVIAIIVAEPLLHELLYAEAIAVPLLLMVPIALQVVLSAAGGGFTAVSKVRGTGSDIARSRLTSTVVGLVALVAGTAAFGVEGAAWALAAMGLLYTAEIAVRVLHDARRSADPRPPDTREADPHPADRGEVR